MNAIYNQKVMDSGEVAILGEFQCSSEPLAGAQVENLYYPQSKEGQNSLDA